MRWRRGGLAHRVAVQVAQPAPPLALQRRRHARARARRAPARHKRDARGGRRLLGRRSGQLELGPRHGTGVRAARLLVHHRLAPCRRDDHVAPRRARVGAHLVGGVGERAVGGRGRRMRGGAAAPTWLAMRRSASSSSSPLRARSRSSVSACGAVTHHTSSHSPSHLRVVGVGVGPSRHVAARPPNTPRCISYTWRHGRPYLGAKPLVHGPGMALAWRWHGADTGLTRGRSAPCFEHHRRLHHHQPLATTSDALRRQRGRGGPRDLA